MQDGDVVEFRFNV
ncbi:hypothetical protein LC082_11755 [Microbacterium esteraromaticum]|nr:hypothetical protein [Microbacterium esteraromaticum]